MTCYPTDALIQLEFESIRQKLLALCRTPGAIADMEQLAIHEDLALIRPRLEETQEYKAILESGLHLPNTYFVHVQDAIRLLHIPGATLLPEQCLQLVRITENAGHLVRWFTEDRKKQYPRLAAHMQAVHLLPVIINAVRNVIDEQGKIFDHASSTLLDIRKALFHKQTEIRRVFDRLAQKLDNLGYLTDIGESFMNGRRVLAVLAEHKRQVKGVLHAESDSRQTVYIEPEETLILNNEIISLEREEGVEMQRILRALTERLHPFAGSISAYQLMRDVFDGIHAKAVFAITIQGVIPQLVNEPVIRLKRAVHPLLWLRQQEQQEQTIPLDIELDQEKRIMVISGPNAGGKTVAMKTVGLLQLMMQSGLLVPVLPDSVMGIFTSLFILIGDRQSIENDLSTYSSHLTHLRYFTAHAHAKTLFFIDELGGGTDPQLGGAMAEAILEELALKQSLGIVTTHYLNLKIMADRVAGLQNASMQFDEQNLKPLFTLKPGIPGSSYTFSMAARVGMAEHIIQRARQLSEKQQIRLESLLRKTEQQSRKLTEERQQLQTLISENKKKESRLVNELNREKHRQEMERLKLQNVESARKRTALRELESTARKLIQAWRKGKDRASIMDELNRILRMAEKTTHAAPVSVSIPADYKRIDDPVVVGSMVFMLKSRKIGIVREIRAKKAVVQLGNVPMQLALDDLVPVVRQENE